MSDEPASKPRIIINTPASKKKQSEGMLENRGRRIPSMRKREELRPLAQQIAQNAEVMQRFRAIIGSGDRDRAEQLILEITKLAQTMDPTITSAEGVHLVTVLMQMVGQPERASNNA